MSRDLKEKVIFFSNHVGFYGPPGSLSKEIEGTFCLYSTENALDLCNQIGITRQEATEIQREAEKIQKEIGDRFPAQVFSTHFKLDCPLDILTSRFYSGEENLVEVGESTDIEECVEMLDLEKEIYFNLPCCPIKKRPHYRNIPGGNLVEKIDYLRDHGTPEEIISLGRDIFRDDERHPFKIDIPLIIELLEEDPNNSLIDLYTEKIRAVKEEDYEKAARIRDGINETLRGENRD